MLDGPSGLELVRRDVAEGELAKPLKLSAKPQPSFPITPSDDPTLGRAVRLRGRVVDAIGRRVPGGVPVVVYGVRDGGVAGAPEPAPVALVVVDTETGGRFGAPWPSDLLLRAHGSVKGGSPVAIPLVDGRLPTNVVLVVELQAADDAACDCDAVPPRAPDPADLTSNPAAFSQDMGGRCVDLTTPNRVLEEFAYFLVVRTSEPEIAGLTLQQRKFVPLPVVQALLSAARPYELLSASASLPGTINANAAVTLDASTVQRLVATDDAPSLVNIANAAYDAELTHVKGLVDRYLRTGPARQTLDADHPIDWDDTPDDLPVASRSLAATSSSSVKCGGADGYSLGDLLHSLPLAPGQRRQIAIVDWERPDDDGPRGVPANPRSG